jgi:hypothetical protein
MGGFDDLNCTSVKLTDFLLRLFAKIAKENKRYMTFTLQTCLVSCLNDTGHRTPIGRGLGLHLSSGKVFLSSVHSSALGPDVDLRNCRAYSSLETLSLVHTVDFPTQLIINIRPFVCQLDIEEICYLLHLPDNLLLRYTSTSPEAEKNNFCNQTRHSFKYIISTSWNQVFGGHYDRPICYRYSTTSDDHNWIRIRF